MNGWSAAVFLSVGWLCVAWGVAEAIGRWWIWPVFIGAGLIVAGFVLFLALVSNARNRQEGRPHA